MTGSARARHPRGRTGRNLPRTAWLTVTAFCSAAALASCGGSSSAPRALPQTSTTPASLASSPASERDQVLGAYRAFWAALTPAANAPASRRQQILAPHAVDPELKSLLDGMAREDAQGRTYYGSPRLRVRLQQFSPGRGIAVISDCQDASKTGDKDVSNGRLLTRGKSRTLVVATLHRTGAGEWKVAFVSFPRHSC